MLNITTKIYQRDFETEIALSDFSYPKTKSNLLTDNSLFLFIYKLKNGSIRDLSTIYNQNIDLLIEKTNYIDDKTKKNLKKLLYNDNIKSLIKKSNEGELKAVLFFLEKYKDLFD